MALRDRKTGLPHEWTVGEHPDLDGLRGGLQGIAQTPLPLGVAEMLEGAQWLSHQCSETGELALRRSDVVHKLPHWYWRKLRRAMRLRQARNGLT